jgi:ribosomal protein L37E
MMLAYQPGDRCIRCGNGGFHVGRTVATCANPHCQLPVPIG